MADRNSQLVAEVLEQAVTPDRASQIVAEVLEQAITPDRASEIVAEVVTQAVAPARVTQLVAEIWLRGWVSPAQTCGDAPPPPDVLPFLYVPPGDGQSVDELSGSSSISDTEVICNDPKGSFTYAKLKSLLADQTNPLLGTPALLLMGFPDSNLIDFVTLATLQVTKAGTKNDGRVYFNLADAQRSMKLYIWTNGGPSVWAPADPTPAAPSGAASAANNYPVSDSNPRYLAGNPMDLLLVAMQNELGVGQADPSDPDTWQLYVPGDDSTLINPNASLDVPGILALRDGQMSGDWVEFTLKARETGKDWIETQILRPFCLYTVVLSTGVMTFKTMKSPPSTSPAAWNDDSILGIPGDDIWPVLNVVEARMNTDDSGSSTSSRSYKADVTYKDDDSIAQFKQELVQQIELTGLRTRRGANARALIYSDRVFRRHGSGTPIYDVIVHLRNLRTELGEFVSLTHRLIPDRKNHGVFGIADVLCEVIDRQPSYDQATLEYKLLDTRFVQQTTAFQIAADDAPDWGSASSEQKATLLFISGDDGTMSDGTAGNTIF